MKTRFCWACLAMLLAGAAGARAATYHVAQGAAGAADDGPGTSDAPWKTISKATEILQPGDTVLIHAGVYREHVRPGRSGTAEAPISYQAAPGEDVVLTGADVVTDWSPAGGGVWKKTPWQYRFPTHPNDEYHRLIGRCEQVIAEGRLLEQVESLAAVAPGTFFADTENKTLYVRLPGDADPNATQVEAGVRSVAFGPGWGREPRDHVHVRGLTIRYAANTAQRGALFALGDGWLVEDCLVEKTNGTGLSFRGDDVTLRRVQSRENGQQGIGGGGGRRFLLEDVAMENNNVKGFKQDWEAGAIKIALARDGVVRRCRAVGNRGNGLWFDIDVRDVLVEDCFCRGNAGHGIFVEISGGFTIRNNLCVANGTGDGWGDGGIAVGESDHVTVENNTCVLNPTGISIRELGPRTCRSIDGGEATYRVRDVTVRRNVSAWNSRYQVGLWWDNPFFGPHPSESVGMRGTPYDPAECNIRFDENVYWMEGDQRLALWGCPWRPKHTKVAGLAAWQSDFGQDAGSLAADPLFVDPAQGDWSLRPDSPSRRLVAGWRTEPTTRGLSQFSRSENGTVPLEDPKPREPQPAAVRELMCRVNAWQLAHPWKETDRNWIRGTWYTGVMAAYQATGERAYLEQARRWADKHEWQPGTERSGGNKLTSTQTYLELYFLGPDKASIGPTIRWLDSGEPNAPSGAKVWYLEGGRRYADSLYVGAPPLAMLAKATGDRKYVDWMNGFFWDVHAEIFDEQAGLFYRDKRFIGQTTASGKKVLWSRGNGWAFASLPRILTYLPEDDPSYDRFEALFKQMAASLAGRQGADGLWRPNLDDPEEFPMPESSGTGFFCYGLAWGVRRGVLDRETYLPVVERAWAGLDRSVSPEGKVQWGQPVGDRPVAVEQDQTHEYVTGTFLLAGSEVLKLVEGQSDSGNKAE
jgi:rhamnogalacturonyl hydrolase YesR